MIPALLYSAAPVSPPAGLQDLFLQYGPTGALAGVGLWFVLKAYAREAERADRAEQKLTETLEKVLPIIQDATRVLGDAAVIIREDRRHR